MWTISSRALKQMQLTARAMHNRLGAMLLGAHRIDDLIKGLPLRALFPEPVKEYQPHRNRRTEYCRDHQADDEPSPPGHPGLGRARLLRP